MGPVTCDAGTQRPFNFQPIRRPLALISAKGGDRAVAFKGVAAALSATLAAAWGPRSAKGGRSQRERSRGRRPWRRCCLRTIGRVRCRSRGGKEGEWHLSVSVRLPDGMSDAPPSGGCVGTLERGHLEATVLGTSGSLRGNDVNGRLSVGGPGERSRPD